MNSDMFALKLWSLNPPKLRCDVDQAPLPFLVSQDAECAAGDDKDVHDNSPSDALYKRQIIVSMSISAIEGDDRDEHKVLVLIEKKSGTKRH